jgi:hypothetical protein
MTDVMSFGGGVQSTAIMTLAGEGLIPMPARWVFSDPGFESADTYAHLERCKEYIAKKGGKLDVVKPGDIERDSLAWAGRLKNSDVKIAAQLPLYLDNPDSDKLGQLPRQCTTKYKIDPIDEYHRREVLGLAPRQRSPKSPAVCVWIGISADEERRASSPGRWRTEEYEVGKDLLGDPVMKERRVWVPTLWQTKAYPLLGCVLYPDRTRTSDDRFAECTGWDREDAKNWLAKSWPLPVPRSACLCCPYRSNDEWRLMRDESPADFARAVKFDHEIREASRAGNERRGLSRGVSYLHVTRKPLDVVDLSEPLNDRTGCGGLFSQEPDGICGV